MDRAAKLALYKDLVAGFEDLAIKGKATAYTSMNGNMFSFLSPDGVWAFRLSEPDREAYETAFGPSEVIQYNSVMRGYVEVQGSLIEDPNALTNWFAKCVENARSLKPKPTKRR